MWGDKSANSAHDKVYCFYHSTITKYMYHCSKTFILETFVAFNINAIACQKVFYGSV